MAQFTVPEWKRIEEELTANPEQYGFPNRVYGSVLLGSFNVRKLGAAKGRSKRTWEFLARICKQFDLIAIQEVMDDLSGMRELMELLGSDFEMIVSDKTGAFPGEPGLGERLAFVYNRRVVVRTEVATDITFDRSKILSTLIANRDDVHEALDPMVAYEKKLASWRRDRRGRRPRRPKLKLPTFLAFIRAPFCVSFEVPGHPGTEPYRFMGVNAHLYFGNYIDDRRQEFDALMDWIVSRVDENDATYYPNFFLFGDLNLDYDNPAKDRGRVERHLKRFDGESAEGVRVNFPFLDPHPDRETVFRTNARMTETFDQIGLFFRDQRFPPCDVNEDMGSHPEGPDYGVFDFVDLFAQAVLNKPFSELQKQEKTDLVKRFEHKVSDHLRLWIRLPLPR